MSLLGSLRSAGRALGGAREFATSAGRRWTVYLSGEIHTDWREQIQQGVDEGGLPVDITSPNVVHVDSDDCGALILGDEENRYWYDKKGGSMNSILTRTLIEEADVVVVRFGPKYRQWNAAFDAGYAAARGTPLITLHDEDLVHPLKEVNAAALLSCRTPQQVVEMMAYVTKGRLPAAKPGFVPMADRLGLDPKR